MKTKGITKLLVGVVAVMGVMACGSSGKSTSGKLGNFVATVAMKEPLEGICNNNQVLALLPGLGSAKQVKAVPPISTEALEQALNQQVTYLKDKPTYNDKGMVGIFINCEGKMVKCSIDNKTQSPELDDQIVAVFATMKNWTPGSYNGTDVDSMELFSFTITNGIISLK